MDFNCPICNSRMPRELEIIIPHTEYHIVEEIKKKHPNWVEENGICAKCSAYYKKQMRPQA